MPAPAVGVRFFVLNEAEGVAARRDILCVAGLQPPNVLFPAAPMWGGDALDASALSQPRTGSPLEDGGMGSMDCHGAGSIDGKRPDGCDGSEVSSKATG